MQKLRLCYLAAHKTLKNLGSDGLSIELIEFCFCKKPF